jgi:hypothetical protein
VGLLAVDGVNDGVGLLVDGVHHWVSLGLVGGVDLESSVRGGF